MKSMRVHTSLCTETSSARRETLDFEAAWKLSNKQKAGTFWMPAQPKQPNLLYPHSEQRHEHEQIPIRSTQQTNYGIWTSAG